MILIGIGANLASSRFASPREGCESALAAIADRGLTITARSPWYGSAPVPASDQPWYVNGVARITSTLQPLDLLAELLAIETAMGRRRSEPNAARIIDLDLLDHDGRVVRLNSLHLPHPRMAARAFVLLPLADVAPGWRHPIDGRTVGQLIAALPDNQTIKRL